MHAALIALATAIVLAGPQPRPASPNSATAPVYREELRAPQQRPSMSISSNALTLAGCLVTLIDDVPVPAQEAGQLTELKVQEGDQVTNGQVLAQVDDEIVRMAEEVTRNELEAAKAESDNDVDVRFAKASKEVAQADLEKSLETNNRQRGTVTDMELRKLWLDKKKAELGIEQAQHNLQLAGLKVGVAEAKHKASLADIKRRQIKSPHDGMIVKQFVHVGEWLKPGDPVVRLLRMDRLCVEGFVEAVGSQGVTRSDVDGRPVTVKVELARGQEVVLRGKIVFVSPETEAGAQFRVKAEVVNERRAGHWALSPGSEASMTIDLGR